jgi:hypothetical protein
MEEIKAEKIMPDQFTKTNLIVNGIVSSKIFFFAPSKQGIQAANTKILPCISGEYNRTIEAEDQIGKLALVDPNANLNNHSDVKVEKGLLKDASGKLSFEAYKIYKPLNAGDPHNIYYKFPTQEDYTIYVLDQANRITIMDEIKAEKITANQFTKTGLISNQIEGSKIFFFAPSKQAVPAADIKVLPGFSRETDKEMQAEDKIGKLAIAGVVIDNHCDVDGRYNHNDFKVERGILKDKSGKMSFEAYKVYEPAKKATEFLARFHGLFFKFPTKEDYLIYSYVGERLSQVGEVKAEEIDTEKYTEVKDVLVTNIVDNAIFFFAPSGQRVSIFTPFSEEGEGAKLADTPMGSVYQYRHWVGREPFDVNRAPYELYARHYLLSKEGDKQVDLLWQDTKTLEIFLTTFAEDLKSEKTVKMPNEEKNLLIAATKSPEGDFYYLTLKIEATKFSAGDLYYLSSRKQDEANPPCNKITIYKASGKYDSVIKGTLDPSINALDIYNMEVATLAYHDGAVYMMCIRTTQDSGDGAHHQVAASFFFDANTLKITKSDLNICSHSWDDDLLLSEAKEFVGVNIGDQYPRGIRLHKYVKGGEMASRVVFSFKRAYTTTALSLLEAKDGYIITFFGQPNAQGSSLDNGGKGDSQSNPDPYNMGFIKVRKDFDKFKPVLSDIAVEDELILTKSRVEEGGIYMSDNDDKSWKPQRNTGAIWLTNYPDKRLSTHSRASFTKDGNVLLMWETRKNDQYENTYAMKVDTNGKILVPAFALGSYVRLDRKDRILNLNGKTVIFTGDGKEQKLELTVLDF